MSNTATNYINLIRKDYPVRGKDNDSQGFRDNFTNISKALETINSDVSTLGNIAVLSNTTATFFGNNIEEANFKNCSTELWDNGTLSGNITLDYTLGSYQKLTVEAGDNFVTIQNWPDEGSSGNMNLAIYPVAEEGVYTVRFIGDSITSLGPSKNPYRLVSGANLFQIYSEYAAGADNPTIHTRLLNELAQLTTSTTQVRADELILNNKKLPIDTGQDVTIRVSTASGSTSATVIQSKVAGKSVSANIGLVANKVVHTVVDIDPTGFVSTTTANKIQLNSVSGILLGATFGLLNNTANFKVTDISTTASVITCTPVFNVGIGTGEVIFRNPMYGDTLDGIQLGSKTAFPTLLTLLDGSEYIAANTSTGRVGVFRGSLYASANTLEITFQDYGSGIKNTFTASTMVSTTASNDSVDLANTQFVHDILPAGSIIMWYGDISNIPTGWKLCDGSTYTVLGTTATVKSPDLRNRFVIGADTDLVVNGLDPINSRVASSSILGQNTTTGGTAVAAIVTHNHVSTGTFVSPPHTHDIEDEGHTHVLTDRAGVLAGDGVARADIDSDDRICLFGSYDLVKTSKSAKTGILIENSTTIVNANLQVLHTGTTYQSSFGTTLSGQPVLEGNNVANIPPFYALAYIIKITGYRA